MASLSLSVFLLCGRSETVFCQSAHSLEKAIVKRQLLDGTASQIMPANLHHQGAQPINFIRAFNLRDTFYVTHIVRRGTTRPTPTLRLLALQHTQATLPSMGWLIRLDHDRHQPNKRTATRAM